MTLLSDYLWPILLVIACGAVGFGIRWTQHRRFSDFIGLNVLILLMAAVYGIERSIVTDRKQLEFSTVDIVRQFQQNRRDPTLAYISDSPQAIPLKALAAAAIEAVDLGSDVHITDVQVTLLAEATRATTHFRVNGTMSLKGHGDVGHHPLRFRATWQKEPDAATGKPVWRMLQVEDLDPISGTPLNRFQRIDTAGKGGGFP